MIQHFETTYFMVRFINITKAKKKTVRIKRIRYRGLLTKYEKKIALRDGLFYVFTESHEATIKAFTKKLDPKFNEVYDKRRPIIYAITLVNPRIFGSSSRT